MRAVIFNRFGGTDVLEIDDIAKPKIQSDEVLVRVHAAAVNPKDTFVRKGRFQRLTGKQFPLQLGYDFAGKVAAIGDRVTNFAKGQAVFGMLDIWQGRTCAEYLAVRENMLAGMPPSLSFTEAAAIPLTASTSLQALRDEADIQNGDHVGINGASGGVGTMAVQITKIFGARVTAISSAVNHDFLMSLGADACIDYNDTDVATGDQRFDIFFDVFGNQPFKRIKPVLAQSGTWVSTVVKPHVFISQWVTRLFGRQKARQVIVKARHTDLALIRDWVEAGHLRPIVQAVFPLEKIRDAHAQQETKHTRGKIVVTID